MSLALQEETKRRRVSKDKDWHVLIATPSQTLTTVCYFGAAIPEGGHVTTEQWEAFVEAHIAQVLL